MYKLHLDPKVFLKTCDIYETIGNLHTGYFRYLMLRSYIAILSLIMVL